MSEKIEEWINVDQAAEFFGVKPAKKASRRLRSENSGNSNTQNLTRGQKAVPPLMTHPTNK